MTISYGTSPKLVNNNMKEDTEISQHNHFSSDLSCADFAPHFDCCLEGLYVQLEGILLLVSSLENHVVVAAANFFSI